MKEYPAGLLKVGESATSHTFTKGTPSVKYFLKLKNFTLRSSCSSFPFPFSNAIAVSKWRRGVRTNTNKNKDKNKNKINIIKKIKIIETSV